MNLPHAVIIAGGAGERLGGVRKGDLRIGGRRLIDRVAAALGPVQQPLMVATGPEGRVSAHLEGALEIPDLAGLVGGPLAGLAAAIASLHHRGITTGLLVSVTVDTPFLPPDFVTVLQQRLGEAPAAYAAWGDQFYPPNALWRIESLADLPAEVVGGRPPRSLKALHQVSGACQVDWTSLADENPFANVNTVADLVASGRTARNSALSPLIHTPGN